jgi:hypothetical protein
MNVPADLIITEQIETMKLNFGKSITLDVENLDPSPSNTPEVVEEDI